MDESSFIRAIIASPRDDLPRLVYADWLDESGEVSCASYLRAELALANVSAPASKGSPLRERLRRALWSAWASVDPNWLAIFTQPRMLRVNPTGFPSCWKNFSLGTLREANGTYGTWPYDSLPQLTQEEYRVGFQYLDAARSRAGTRWIRTASQREDYDRMVAGAVEKNIRLPERFLEYMANFDLRTAYRSVTDCYFRDGEIWTEPSGDAHHIHFYTDSQDCLHWDLYVHRNGAHCVIARWPDYFERVGRSRRRSSSTKDEPQIWFVAPSFESFMYRIWLENSVWDIEHADFMRRQGNEPLQLTPAIQEYIEHYQNAQVWSDFEEA